MADSELFCLHFDIGVGVAVGIHGRQVNTAHHSHHKAVGLGAVHEGHQDPTTLLRLSAVFPRLGRDSTQEKWFRWMVQGRVPADVRSEGLASSS